MQRRYDELDSMRGLAATTVLFSHLVLAFGYLSTSDGFLEKLIRDTPLHIVYAGHEAVILFFVLSGFVLSLSYVNGRTMVYSQFIVPRMIRLYLPVIVMVLFVLIIRSFIIVSSNPEAGEWISSMWQKPMTASNLFEHFTLVGLFDYGTYNPVLWTLVHEMRISFIFPFLLMLVLKYNWKTSLFVGLILSCVGGLSHHLFGEGHISFSKTAHYTFMFIMGSVMAKHLNDILDFFKKKSKKISLLFIALGVLIYTYRFWFFPEFSLVHNTLIDDWAAALGASILLVMAISYRPFTKALHLKPILFLGKISFSFYLYHLIAMLIVFNLLSGVVSSPVLIALSIILSVLLATAGYYVAETPSIKMGRWVRNKMKSKESVLQSKVG